MNTGTAVLLIGFLIVLRFGLPLALMVGGGYLSNAWLKRQAQRERIV